MKNNLILISTTFRSGSGLLSRILNAHENITLTYDKIKFFLYCHNKYGKNNIKVKILLSDLENRLVNRFGIKINVDDILNSLKKEKSNLDYPKIYRAILSNIHKPSIEQKYIGEMQNLAWRQISTFFDQYNGSKALVILRDPRDVLVSFKKHTISKGYNYLISIFNFIDVVQYSKYLKKKYPKKFKIVKYEDLKSDTINIVKEICKFLRVEFNKKMLNEKYWLEYSDNQWKPWANLKTSSFKSNKRLLNSPINRWKKIISDQDLYLCELLAKKEMKYLNYSISKKSFSDTDKSNSIKNLTDNKTLNIIYKKWKKYGTGVQQYPLNPFDKKTWDKWER